MKAGELVLELSGVELGVPTWNQVYYLSILTYSIGSLFIELYVYICPILCYIHFFFQSNNSNPLQYLCKMILNACKGGKKS